MVMPEDAHHRAEPRRTSHEEGEGQGHQRVSQHGAAQCKETHQYKRETDKDANPAIKRRDIRKVVRHNSASENFPQAAKGLSNRDTFYDNEHTFVVVCKSGFDINCGSQGESDLFWYINWPERSLHLPRRVCSVAVEELLCGRSSCFWV